MEPALALLTEAWSQHPEAPELPLKLANLNLRLGKPDQAQQILERACQHQPHHIPLSLQRCRLHLQFGQFGQATDLLNTIDSDQSSWLKQVEQLRGEIALSQFQQEQAIPHFQRAIQYLPATPYLYEQLAQALMVQGDLDRAYQQLVLATKQLHQKRDPHQKTIPLKNHTAFLMNQLRLNPPLLAKLQRVQSEMDRERLEAIGDILAQDPTYLGASFYLAKELRQQQNFCQHSQSCISGCRAFPSNSSADRTVLGSSDPTV